MRERDVAVFHTADLHLGGFRHAYNYLERTEKCCNAFAESVLSCKAKAIIVVIAGDFWDTKALKEPERNLGIRLLFRLLSDSRVRIVMLNGNHDYYDHKGLTMISSFQAMLSYNLVNNLHVVINEPGVEVVRIDDLTYVFLCIPCQQHLTSNDLSKLLRTLLKAAPKKRTRCYAIIHEALLGSSNEHNYKFDSKVELTNNSATSSIDGYMLGDIHRKQQVRENAWYCGSPWQTKYDEERSKGYLKWIGSEVEFIPLQVPMLIETGSVKEARKFINTDHSVQYTGLQYVEFESLNIQHIPKVVDAETEAVAVVDEVNDIARIRSITSKDMVKFLPTFLKNSAKLPDDEIEYGIKYAKQELQI